MLTLGISSKIKAKLLRSASFLYNVFGLRTSYTSDFVNNYYKSNNTVLDLESNISFSRSGKATYLDSTGTLQVASDGVPRVGSHVWDGSAWVNAGVRFESKSVANVVHHTTPDESKPEWSTIRATHSLNAAQDIDGTWTMTKIVEDTSLAQSHYQRLTLHLSPNRSYVIGGVVRADGRDQIQIATYVSGGWTVAKQAIFDIVDGTVVSTVGDPVCGIVPLGPDHAFIWLLNVTDATAGNRTIDWRLAVSGSTAYDGNGTAGVYVSNVNLWPDTVPRSLIRHRPTLTNGIVADTTNVSGNSVTRTDLEGDYFGFPGLLVASTGATWNHAVDFPYASLIGGETYRCAFLYQFGTSGKAKAQLRDVSAGESHVISSGGAWTVSQQNAGAVGNVTDVAISGDIRLLQFDFTPPTDGGYGLGFGPNSAVAGEDVILAAWHMVHEDDAGFPCGIMQGESLSVPSANLPDLSGGFTVAMDGHLNYTDNDTTSEAQFWRIFPDGSNYARVRLETNDGSGKISIQQNSGGTFDSSNSDGSDLTPGLNVPYSIASRHSSSDVNGALNGVAFTANTTVTSLSDLTGNNMLVGETYIGHIKSINIWGQGMTDVALQKITE